MLITARDTTGPGDDRGIVGHAWSPDLRDWHLRPPLSGPGQSFSQLEVTQVEVIDGQTILLLSCLGSQSRALTGPAPVSNSGCAEAMNPMTTDRCAGPSAARTCRSPGSGRG